MWIIGLILKMCLILWIFILLIKIIYFDNENYNVMYKKKNIMNWIY